MMVRRLAASMRRPRARWGRMSRAAVTMWAAESAPAGKAADRAAAIAVTEEDGIVMKKTSGERGRIEPRGALSRPRRLKPVPARLFLWRHSIVVDATSAPNDGGQPN